MDDVTYVRNLEAMHEAAPDVSQACTNRRMRLLSGDLGQSFRKRCFHSDPWIESQGVVLVVLVQRPGPSAKPKSCIACMNDGVRILIGDSKQKVGSEVEKTMTKLQASGHAGEARMVEFEDKKGRVTKGTLYPDKLHESVWGAVIEMAGGDVGWSIFGMSLMHGYHSVILTLDNSDPRRPHIYWSDQWSKKGGWLEYDRVGLDAEITHLTQNWWTDVQQKKNVGYNTRVTLWRLNK